MVESNANWLSFGLGVGVGIFTTLAVQRARRWVAEGSANNPRPVVQVRTPLTMDRGYINRLVRYAQQEHLAGNRVPLQDILIEPLFIQPPEVVSIPEENVPGPPFENVPLIYDFPLLHEPYNIPTLTVDALSRGHHLIAIVGLPGSGRTTALLTIALWSMGFLDFEAPPDSVKAHFIRENDELPLEERAKRIRNRVALAARERERYLESQEEDPQDALPEDPRDVDLEIKQEPSPFRERAPLYVHLNDVPVDRGESGRNLDPAEPFVRALQEMTGRIVSMRMVRRIYTLLENGQALVLIDGYDDLPHERRPVLIEWIRAFLRQYGHNYVLIAMPPHGYGPLMESGVAPAHLRPWHHQLRADAIQKYADHWEKFGTHAPQFDREKYDDFEEYTHALSNDLRGHNVLESTLGMWSQLRNEEPQTIRMIPRYLRMQLPQARDLLPQLTALARIQLDQGTITQQAIYDYLLDQYMAGQEVNPTEDQPSQPAQSEIPDSSEEDAVAPASTSAADDDFLDSFFAVEENDTTQPEEGPATDDTIAQEADSTDKATDDDGNLAEDDELPAAEERKLRKEARAIIKQLTTAGLLVRHRNERYRFRHRAITDYLGAQVLVQLDEEALEARFQNPDWRGALRYLPAYRDVDPFVAQQLEQPLDIRYESLLELSYWLRYAPSDAPWRAPLLQYMGNLFLAPNQYTIVRHRMAAALLNTRLPEVRRFFDQAVRGNNLPLIKTAILALGAMGAESVVSALAEIAINGANRELQICAAIALGAINTDRALISLADALATSNEEEVRRAVAETFAMNRRDGYPTLLDAVESKEMLMRRAATFGISRIRTDWAWVAVDHAFLEDGEWYVRSAAQVALSNLYETELRGVPLYPEAEQTPWVIKWGEDQIDMGNVPYDITSKALFERAFHDQKDHRIRQLALQTAGQTGATHLIDQIYAGLRDQQEQIRDQAYAALVQFQERFGQPLPAPTA